MASPTTVADLLTLLRKSGLIDPGALAPHQADLPDTPIAAAKKLIKLGLITPYHAEHLLAGRSKGFFLGAYRLLGKLGKGGMGAVYLAEHTSLKRRVAIKVFPPEKVADPPALARFQREGRAAAALDHPNIVRVHDIAQAGPVHFLVMEYAEGVTLDQLMKEKGPLPPDQVIGYARQVAAALAHAHGKGIVHRDIKPANLILDPSGVVKVLDIGLARITHDSNDDLTRRIDEHAVLGTADYIAPEQALSSAVDGRADLYSLGATLYALLAGSPPFGGKSISQKLVAHQMKEAAPLADVRPSVPPALAAIVGRLMEKKPEDRYPSADALLAALDGKPVPAARPRRAPWPAAAAAAVLTLSAAAAGGWWVMAGRAPTPEPRAERPAPKPVALKPDAPKPVAPTPVATASPPPVYRLDLAGHPITRREGKKGGWLTLDGPIGQRWKGSIWNPEATCAFAVEQTDGRPVLSLRMVEGKSGGFFVLRELPLKAGRRYALDVSYRHEGGGTTAVRILHPGKKAVDLIRPRPTPGRWTEFTQVFEPEADGHVGLEFHLSGPAPDAALFLGDVTVRDAGPLTDPYPLRTFRWEGPFRVRVKHRETVAEEGTVPADVRVQAWGADAAFEARAVTDGRPALKLVMLEGKPSGMLFLTTPPPRTDRTYTLRVEYRTRGKPRGHVKFRHPSTTAEELGRLTDSPGWRVMTWQVEPTREEPVTVEIHQQGGTPADELWIGKVQWIEDGVAAE